MVAPAPAANAPLSVVVPSPNGTYDPYAPSQADVTRKQKMSDAWRAYHGELTPPLKVKPGTQDDNVRINRCKPIAAKGVSFLFGKDVTFTVEKPDSATRGATNQPKSVRARKAASATATPGAVDEIDAKTQAAQDWLDACLSGQDSPNDIMTLLAEAALNAAVCGHAFLKIQPQDADDGDGDTNASAYPRLVNLDPQNVRILTDPDDVSTILAYVVEWQYADWRTGEQVRRRQLVEREHRQATSWTISEWEQRGTQNVYMPLDEDGPQVWPHKWAPILDVKNLPNPNEAWGAPDLEDDLIQLNRALNFVATNTHRIIRFHAHPKTWGKGFDVKQLTTSVDGVIGIPSENGELHNLEMASDLSSSLQHADTLRTDMDELSRVPAVALGRLRDMPRGNVSGVALELMFQPLIEKTQTKRRLWAAVLRQLCAYLLELGGFGAGRTVTTNWPQILPRDETADAQSAVVKEQLGVSKHTLLDELGYRYDEEQEYKREEDQQDMLAALHGQAMLPPTPTPGMGADPTQQQPGQPQQPGTAPNGQQPPVNHPAAIRARAMMQQATQQ